MAALFLPAYHHKGDHSPQSHEELLATASQLVTSLKGQEIKKESVFHTSLVEVSKGNHCPTPGCTGIGHVTGMYAMHYAVSGCPKAHGKTPEECKVRDSWTPPLITPILFFQARREELNKLKILTTPVSDNTTSLPIRKTPRLQAARSLTFLTTPSSSVPSAQHTRISQLHVCTQYMC